MQYQNQSRITVFFLQGILDYPKIQIPLFFVFLILYLLGLIGNLLIFLVICLDYQLHMPMYFFLCNLSVLDMLYASVTQPRFLSILLMNRHNISFAGCITQLYVFMVVVATEYSLLTVMSYDRYLAICKPLQYPLLMSSRAYILLATFCWVTSFLDCLPHIILISLLPFCETQINHFYCDYSELLKMSCVDTFKIRIMTYMFGVLISLPSFSITLASYIYIIYTVLKIPSSISRYKTFSTCVPHLTVVILYYSTILTMHMIPSSKQSSSKEKMISLLYTILIPSANPFIYTLRNKDVKQSFYKIKKYIFYMQHFSAG